MTEQRRQNVRSQRPVEHLQLKQETDREHDRQGDERGDERVEPERGDEGQNEEGGEHDEIAVSQIDQAHDAEDQREPGGEERVEPAEQNALDQRVDEAHHPTAPK